MTGPAGLMALAQMLSQNTTLEIIQYVSLIVVSWSVIRSVCVRVSGSVGECESHSQLMSKFVILNNGVIDKVCNCRRQEGNGGAWGGRTDS